MVEGCSHSAINIRIGVSASMCSRICAIARNCLIAVELSMARLAKLVRSGCTSSSIRRNVAIAPLLARSSAVGSFSLLRIALCNCLAFTRKWMCPIPSPSARMAAASDLRAIASAVSAPWASSSNAAMIGASEVSLAGSFALNRLAAAERSLGAVRSSEKLRALLAACSAPAWSVEIRSWAGLIASRSAAYRDSRSAFSESLNRIEVYHLISVRPSMS